MKEPVPENDPVRPPKLSSSVLQTPGAFPAGSGQRMVLRGLKSPLTVALGPVWEQRGLGGCSYWRQGPVPVFTEAVWGQALVSPIPSRARSPPPGEPVVPRAGSPVL